MVQLLEAVASWLTYFLHHWNKAQDSAFWSMTEKSWSLSQANSNPYILGDSPTSLGPPQR